MHNTSPEAPVVARLQGGVFTAEQAVRAGWTPRQVRRRLESGQWRRVAGRALTVAGPTPSALAFAWAAHLTWPFCVVSHVTAGILHGFPLAAGDAAHVTVSRDTRSARGIVAHNLALGPSERRRVHGVPVTGPERTALDCLAILDPDDGFELWAWVSTRGVLDRHQLAAGVRARFGWPGTPNLVALLRMVSGGAASPPERRLLAALKRAGITGWVAGARIEVGGRVIAVADVLFPEARLVIEVDGWAAHSSRDAFARDRRRQNRLGRAGYRVLRFTAEEIRRQPEAVVAEIAQMLAGGDQDRQL